MSDGTDGPRVGDGGTAGPRVGSGDHPSGGDRGDAAVRSDGGTTGGSADRGADRPLSGLTVLELGHIVAGPFCALLLADLGADVIKVEHPDGGDAIRDSSPLGNSSFNYVNRDKRSVTVDLKSAEGRAVFADLAAEADVLVENFAPGTAERLGIGYEDLREDHPELVYCSIKGFNPGPYERYPALDPVAEALSGVMSVTGHPGQPPVRCGTSVADMTASFYGAIAVLGALRRRDATGEGGKVTAPLFESTVALMGYWLSFAQAYDEVPGPLGASHPNWAPYDVFRAGDGEWVFVGPSSQRQWVAMCEALDLDLHRDERFATLEDRREHVEALTDLLDDAFGESDAETLVARLRDAGVPVAPVNDAADVAADPHLAETDALAEVTTAEGRRRTVRVPRFPVRASGFERVDSDDPPRLGEHTDEVLSSLGYSAEEIEAMRDRGAV
ncbi:CaiB/BaiF CoA transferase family protein [Halegenticoccus soli]|uniref:CaiB/BaiF CoA transferase family protein n=1 Tax=Halegenticoccus soli TaxID=1985678 RepID=UPI000C6E2E84|nr:CaiB/BaiF CoA-transferase family protein [Halegenticoccus soli]